MENLIQDFTETLNKLKTFSELSNEHAKLATIAEGMLTELHNNKQKLSEIELRFHELAGNLPEVFWICSNDLSQMFYVSPAFEKIWKRSCESLYSNPHAWIEPIHPEDLQMVATAFRDQSPDNLFSIEYRIILPDGSIRWIWDRAFSMTDYEGDVKRIAGIAEDITERKLAELSLIESERRYRTLTAISPVGIFRTDQTGRATYFNQRCCDICGFPHDYGLGDGWRKSIHPDDAPLLFEAWRKAVITQQYFSFETRFMHKNKYVWGYCEAIPEFNPRGNFVGHVGTVTDITQLKSAEKELQHHQQELAKINKSNTVGTLASSIAHEVNQPLTVIGNYATACLQEAQIQSNEHLTTMLEKIIENVDRAGSIVHRIKDFMRKGKLVKSEVNLNETIENVLELASARIKENKINLEIRLSSTIANIVADQVQLEQVFLNLVQNAIDILSTVSYDRHLIVKTIPKEPNHVAVLIKDNGPGIELDKQQQIFDPFFTTSQSGMGLGLAIVHSIIETDKGQIMLESKPELGTSFTILLPIK